MIRTAQVTDIDQIMEIVQETIAEMHSYGNYQWDENYPNKNDFLNDIQKGDLFVAENHGNVVGFICINTIEPVEYQGLNWPLKAPSFILHRMSISPTNRNGGIGLKFMQFAEQLAQEQNISSLKTDTYSLNTKANRLFKKCGFKLVGEMSFLGKEKPFFCYEKKL